MLKELEKTMKCIKTTDATLTSLELKAVNLVECCDFNVCEITHQGQKAYILYDCQSGDYRGETSCKTLDEFIDCWSMPSLKDVILLLTYNFYEDYGFDTDKVFDESILHYEQCYVDNDEEDEDFAFTKEELQSFADEIGYTSTGNINSDFTLLLNFARKMAQKEAII